MRATVLIASLIIVILIICAEAQVYDVIVIDIPDNSPQAVGQQRPQQRAKQLQQNTRARPVVQTQNRQPVVQQTRQTAQRVQQVRPIRRPQVTRPTQQQVQRRPQPQRRPIQQQVAVVSQQPPRQQSQTQRRPQVQQPVRQQQPQRQQQILQPQQQPTRRHTQQSQKPVVTFPVATNRPSAAINQNAGFSRPSNPFLSAGISRVPQVQQTKPAQARPVQQQASLIGAVAGSQTTTQFHPIQQQAGFIDQNNAAPITASFQPVVQQAGLGASNVGSQETTQFRPAQPQVYENTFVPGNEGGEVTAFSTVTTGGFDGVAVSSSSGSNFGGFADGSVTSFTNDGNVVENGFNNFVRIPGNANGFNAASFDGSTGGNDEDFNNYRRFGPHRPNENHYRDFAGIFNAIDQKAESDYNTSDEDNEMNDDFNGRSVVSPGQYPHMAALGYRTSTGETEFKCGGSLISEMFVLTAAHCCFLNGQAPHLVKIGDIKLKEFEHYLMPQRRGVARVIKHPYYNESLFYNDIGLLELTNPIVYTYFVRPIRLWARDEIPYDRVFTMGYGSTSFAQAQTNILTELDLSIVPLETCNSTMPPNESSPYGITESQICAKDYELNRDTCQGDSGGPLQLNLERPRRRRLRYYLVGVISYGTFCRSQHPGVYTRVSSYIDWIASEVWPDFYNNF